MQCIHVGCRRATKLTLQLSHTPVGSIYELRQQQQKLVNCVVTNDGLPASQSTLSWSLLHTFYRQTTQHKEEEYWRITPIKHIRTQGLRETKLIRHPKSFSVQNSRFMAPIHHAVAAICNSASCPAGALLFITRCSYRWCKSDYKNFLVSL